MTSSMRIILATVLILTPLLSACSASQVNSLPEITNAVEMDWDPELPYPPERPPVVGDILHMPTGFFVDETQMLKAATDARIVYVGETHDNPASHRVELKVLRAMNERYPGGVALGMEMFQPAQQEALDAWVAGEISEKEFLKDSGWFKQWKMDFAYYRDLLVFARQHRIPVVGLNVPNDLVEAVMDQRPEELSDEERAALPEMDFNDPYQRAMTEAMFKGHDAGTADIEGFLRVQTLWDEAMAENAARYLSSPEGQDMRLLVVAGGNHIRYGFGIPRRVFRRLPTSYSLVGSKEIEIPEDERRKERMMDVELPPFPMPSYDFMVFTAYEDLKPKRVLLGVVLNEKEGKVSVNKVLPGSVAEKVGVEKGDIIVRFDGEPVKENFDLIYAVRQKRPGDRAELVIERNGEEITFDVIFSSPKPHHKTPPAP